MPIFFPTIPEHKNLSLKKWVNENADAKEMKFEILIPDGYEIIKQDNDIPTVEKTIIDCVFLENKSQAMQIIVQCLFIESEVSLLHYLEYFANTGNEKIIEQRCLNNDSDKPDMLLEKIFDDGQTWITRRTAYKRWAGEGAYVIIANVATNQQLYNQHAQLLFTISNSLKPIGKPEYDKAERLKLITKRYPLDFATYLPWSWEDLHHHNDTLQQMNLGYVKKLRGKVTGVFSISSRTWSEEYYEMNDVLKEMHKPYIDQGAKFQQMVLTKSNSINGINGLMNGTVEFEQEPGNSSKKNNISFFIVKKNNAWFYSEIFGPSKETDFEAWAINNRAMEIANENMRIL